MGETIRIISLLSRSLQNMEEAAQLAQGSGLGEELKDLAQQIGLLRDLIAGEEAAPRETDLTH